MLPHWLLTRTMVAGRAVPASLYWFWLGVKFLCSEGKTACPFLPVGLVCTASQLAGASQECVAVGRCALSSEVQTNFHIFPLQSLKCQQLPASVPVGEVSLGCHARYSSAVHCLADFGGGKGRAISSFPRSCKFFIKFWLCCIPFSKQLTDWHLAIYSDCTSRAGPDHCSRS